MKKLTNNQFRKMAEESILVANWASYQVFLKNGTEATEGKVQGYAD